MHFAGRPFLSAPSLRSIPRMVTGPTCNPSTCPSRKEDRVFRFSSVPASSWPHVCGASSRHNQQRTGARYEEWAWERGPPGEDAHVVEPDGLQNAALAAAPSRLRPRGVIRRAPHAWWRRSAGPNATSAEHIGSTSSAFGLPGRSAALNGLAAFRAKFCLSRQFLTALETKHGRFPPRLVCASRSALVLAIINQ